MEVWYLIYFSATLDVAAACVVGCALVGLAAGWVSKKWQTYKLEKKKSAPTMCGFLASLCFGSPKIKQQERSLAFDSISSASA